MVAGISSGTKVCSSCNQEKPYEEYGASAVHPTGYFRKCIECRRQSGTGRNGRWSGEAPKGEKKKLTREEVLATRIPPSILTKQATENHFAEGSRRRSLRAALLPDRETCSHFRLSGEASIRTAFPEFYNSYEEPPMGTGMVWEVCVWCGDVQQVSVMLDGTGARTTRYTRVAIPETVREKYPLPAARLLPEPEPQPPATPDLTRWRMEAHFGTEHVEIQGPSAAAVGADPADEEEIARIAVEIMAVDPEASAAAIDAEAREWGNWDRVIVVAGEEKHPKCQRAIQLLAQAIGLPAMEDEYEVEFDGSNDVPDLPPDHHVGVGTPSGLIAHIDPSLIGTAEGEELLGLLDKVGDAVKAQFGGVPKGGPPTAADEENWRKAAPYGLARLYYGQWPGDIPEEDFGVFDGSPTTPLHYTDAPTYGEDPAIQDLHLLLAEQEELIEQLRDQLRSLEGRARVVIEADQAAYKVQLAWKDAALDSVIARLGKAERLLAYAWGTARSVETSAREAADLLQAFEQA